jgi:hypothetical protein
MKFAFGIPAWLGGIKVVLVMCGPPMVLTLVLHRLINQRSDSSDWISFLIFLGLFSAICLMWWSIVVVSARRNSKRKQSKR